MYPLISAPLGGAPTLSNKTSPLHVWCVTGTTGTEQRRKKAAWREVESCTHVGCKIGVNANLFSAEGKQNGLVEKI